MRFDPATNLELVALRSAWRDVGPGPEDRLDPSLIVTDGVDGDGKVTRVRALSAVEVLDVLIRDVRGDVDA